MALEVLNPATEKPIAQLERAGIDETRFSSFDDRLNQAARKMMRVLNGRRQE